MIEGFTKEFDMIVLGLAVTDSVTILAGALEAEVAMLFFVSLTMCVNFFFAKMKLLAEGGEKIANVTQFYIHLMPLFLLVFICASIDNLPQFIIANLLFRLADIIGILYWAKKNSLAFTRRDISWLLTDVIVMSYLGFFLCDLFVLNWIGSLVISVLILMFWCIDMLVDYRLQHSFYFNS